MTPTPIHLQRARVRLQALVDAYPELRSADAQARLSAWLEKEQQAMTGQKGTPKGDTTAYVRMKRMRERRLAEGWQTYQVWLRGEDAALLIEVKQPGENLSDTFARGLHALAALTPQDAQGHPGKTPMFSDQRREILTLLHQHPEGLSPVQTRQLLGADKDLGSTMKSMARDGLLRRLRPGIYAVSDVPHG